MSIRQQDNRLKSVFYQKLSGRFLLGALMVMVGMMFFTLGAEMSMTPMGEKVGARMTQSKNVWLITILSFVLGVIITISEPDLQVLATQVPSVPNMTLILAVAIGVGIFLVIALLRMLFGIALPHLLVFFYLITFTLVFFVPADFRAVAFDSGGVTTGPMTVPFIMALGVGISAIRNDKHAADDSFGLVALCSIGPILAVLILGMIYRPTESSISVTQIPQVGDSVELLPLAQGACVAVGGNLVTDAFGVVAMVAMTPLITIQILGMVYQLKQRFGKKSEVEYAFAALDEDAIIEL